MEIEIDNSSGFCFGVTTAIEKAEDELTRTQPLYCLGDIVHNGMECQRLADMGLVTIDHQQMANLVGVSVLLRAHGEPPSTYTLAQQNNITIIDATCPVVLALQRRIRRQYEEDPAGQIIIFGKKGHAEVLGLVGQTDNHALVVSSFEDVVTAINSGAICLQRPIYLYSQTTKSLDEYNHIINYIREHTTAPFRSHDTICRRVANRMPNCADFAARHDLILFVCGRKSSNGRVLYEECLRVNPNTHLIEGPDEIQSQWLTDIHSVGICGATSTPKWLMEQCKDRLLGFRL